MDSPTKLVNKSFVLGVVVGGMLAGIAGLAVFLYIDGPQLIGSASAGGRGRDSLVGPTACQRLLATEDREVLIAFGHFANRTSTTGEVVMMGRKSDEAICDRALDMLSRNLSPSQYSAVTACVVAAPTDADVLRCWND